MAKHRITAGDAIPEVTLVDPSGAPVRLRELAGGRPLVVFFYPKDNSPVCTAEACAFRDAWSEFETLGATLVGISGDGPDSHRRVVDKRALPYPLLSDPDGSARRAFGVPRTLGVFPGRYTYVADRQGIVRHVFGRQLASGRHVAEALEALRRLAETPGRDEAPGQATPS